jgi:hypothetical protein
MIWEEKYEVRLEISMVRFSFMNFLLFTKYFYMFLNFFDKGKAIVFSFVFL